MSTTKPARHRLLAVSHTGRASGAEVVLVRTLAHAAGRGWDVACASGPGPLVDRLGEAGVRHVPIPELTLPAGSRPLAGTVLAGRTMAAALLLRSACAQADVVVSNGLLALPALRLARPRAPVAWVVHDVIRRPDRLRVLRLACPVVDLALPVSEAAAEPLTARGVPVRVVRNGTPWPVDPAPPEGPEPPVVGCSALLTSWKGQDVLLEAVAVLDRTDVVVELMGGRFPKDAAFVAALEERAARPDLDGRVRFLGHVADPLARMRTWSLAVSPSLDPEAGPLALIEAMSLGLPVVGTRLGGTTEVIGDAGLLVPPGDPAALAQAIGE
ncbi:MAG TPA: glycosyltransferase family 4 protein, partial [Acidimicrobiales bacterium]|nr:glycosyltransferase family 4 protein [Acidimicrobiales bacterium]